MHVRHHERVHHGHGHHDLFHDRDRALHHDHVLPHDRVPPHAHGRGRVHALLSDHEHFAHVHRAHRYGDDHAPTARSYDFQEE